MAQQDRFQWHAAAALCVGTKQIARPDVAPSVGFRNISEEDLQTVLQKLAATIVSGDPFCISDAALPQGVAAPNGSFLTLTGGSSGAPKGVCRTQASWISSFEVNRKIFDLRQGQSVASLGRLSHSLSLYAVIEGLHLGLNVHVLAGMSPAAQRDALRRHKIETLYATPTQLRLLASGHADGILPELRHILCGGGALDHATLDTAQALGPNASIRQFYGAAETSFITLSDAQTPKGSVGKPYPNVELLLEDAEVFVRSPYLFTGYATKDNKFPIRADGFVSVGEIGSLDDEGNLWLKGRKSRMVNIADQCVYPEEIERRVLAQTDVTNCAVLSQSDATRGQRLVIVIEGCHDASLATEVKNMCRAAFGPMIAPRRVLFHPSLPQLASGKIDFTSLSTWLEGQV